MSREHELDVDEIERIVARTLLALVDGPREAQRISARSLAERSGLPLRRVREVVALWQLSTVSGDTLFLSPDALEHARKIVS